MKLVKNLIYNYAFSKKYSPYVLVEQSRKHTFVCFFVWQILFLLLYHSVCI